MLDVNDRALRHVVIGLGSDLDGLPRQTGFDITAASEVMAILSLATSLDDLRARLGRTVVGYARSGAPVTAADLRTSGAMLAILQDAIKPNLLQTLEHTPVLVHTGPFGNIAHGNSSVLADLIGIRTGDFLVTEAGFGADMGAERFFDIKCPVSGLRPDAAVVVATVRALKVHSGHHHVTPGRPLPEALLQANPDEVHEGAANLRKQIDNVRQFGVPPVVAINAFPTDHACEWQAIAEIAESMGVRVAVSQHFARGGRGAVELAEAVADACAQPAAYAPLYSPQASLPEKIETVARRVYGADGVDYAPAASAELERYERLGYAALPVCIAKTHLSLSFDAQRPGAPRGWRLPVREVRAAIGAGYVYVVCGDMQTMPGLGAHPAVETIDVDANGNVVGLTQGHLGARERPGIAMKVRDDTVATNHLAIPPRGRS